MPSISRSLLRWGIISGIALGGLTVLIGPDRVGAAFDQVRFKARQATDGFVEDPVALRRQLEQLAEQYPTRIGQVRGEIAEISRQMQQLEHDTDVSRRVVSMASDDLDRLRLAVAGGATPTGQLITLRESQRGSIDAVKEDARRINNVRLSYQDRFASSKQQIQFLTQQKERLDKILQRLETEYSDFESKMAILDRQIDSIERNERLIDMTKEQQAMLAGYDRLGEVGNLGQLEAKLAELRIVQEAQLEALSRAGVPSDYEQRAKAEIADEKWEIEDPFGLTVPIPAIEPARSSDTGASKPVASATGLPRKSI